MRDEWTIPEAILQASSSTADEVLTERFLSGSIPLAWLMAMFRLGEEASRAGTLIWHVSGLRKRVKRDLLISPSLWQEYFTTRQSYSRALARLESAGLIAVDRRPGHRLRVSILTAPAPPEINTATAGTVAAVNAQAATAALCGISCEGAASI